jgi:hypothetical protein
VRSGFGTLQQSLGAWLHQQDSHRWRTYTAEYEEMSHSSTLAPTPPQPAGFLSCGALEKLGHRLAASECTRSSRCGPGARGRLSIGAE